MAATVQASSLSSLTALAADPPRRPREPTSNPQVQDSLVLYIARVPGSRDVFLTTMKPRHKVVTAEDVSSSLYYLHVARPEDDRLLGEMLEEDDAAGKDDQHRIPVGQEIRGSADSDHPQKAMPHPHYQARRTRAVTRKPVPALGRPRPAIQQQNPLLWEGDGDKLSERRPLGPRQDRSDQKPARKPLPGRENDRANGSESKYAASFGHGDQNGDILDASQRNIFPGEDSVERRDVPLSETTKSSITLIRRDPTSGGQWNVGIISTGSDPSEDSRRPTEETLANVEIFTTGYRKFLDTAVSGGRPGTQDEGQEIFRRHVHVEGSGFWQRNFGKRRSSSDRSSSDLGLGQEVPLLEPKGRAKRVVFSSPWNGRCEFVTGSGGRSVKCNHTLPSSIAPISASELHFNLPRSHMTHRPSSSLSSLPSPSNYPSTVSLASKRSSTSSFFRPKHPPSPAPIVAEAEVDDEERFSVRLGREKAGGGNRGKRAKLGKLIVHPEGMAMLDLLVGANMGLWWRVWHGRGQE